MNRSTLKKKKSVQVVKSSAIVFQMDMALKAQVAAKKKAIQRAESQQKMKLAEK